MIDEVLLKQYGTLIKETALSAGIGIMKHYNQKDSWVRLKDDESPVTIADLTAHKIITDALEATGLPVLSEEGADISFNLRKNWCLYWLVDPLDGTKEYISGNGEFTVNIALISDAKPILGAVYAPVPGILYYTPEYNTFRTEVNGSKREVQNSIQKDVIRVAGSRSHHDFKTDEFCRKLEAETGKKILFEKMGSSLKICRIASGEIDICPRFTPTMEWDTAAAHAVLNSVGGALYNPYSGMEFYYNRQSLKNGPFLAVSSQYKGILCDTA